MVGALGAVSHMRQFAIADILVTGTETLPRELLSQAVRERLDEGSFRLFSRKNIFLYPKSTIESGLETDFPRIKEVSLARESLLASALLVTVEERTPYASWCRPAANMVREGASMCYVFDSRGFVFAEQTETPEKPYVFYGGLIPDAEVIGQTFLQGRLPGVVSLLEALAVAGYEPRTFTVESESDFTITLARGQRILATFDMQEADVIRNLATALEAEGLQEKFDSLEYIDLRFGNRVYYK